MPHGVVPGALEQVVENFGGTQAMEFGQEFNDLVMRRTPFLSLGGRVKLDAVTR